MKTVLPSTGPSPLTQSFCRQRAAVFFMLPLVLIMSGVVSVRAQSQPAPKSTASPPPTQVEKRGPNENAPATGSIKGRVVADDGRPVVNARLMAQAVTGPAAIRPAQVDPEGKFSFDDLPPAGYIVMATAPGYIDEAITGDPSEWPRHLIGAQLKITMTKGGVITGKVTNSKGDPIVGVPVHAMALNNPSWSPTDFMGTGGAETDDRGIYRIYGLRPGQYVVNAGGAGQFGFAASNGFDLDVPTYHPSATRDTAVPVVVRSGDETAGIDIKYFGTEGHRISGVVLGNTNNAGASAAMGAVAITLSPAGTQSLLSLAIASPIDQRRAFSFNGVADGEYDLFAAFQTGQQNDPSLVATKRVTVRGGDVTGVELTLTQLASIAGTITLDPAKPEDKCDQRGSQVIETVFSARRDDRRKSGSHRMTTMLAGLGPTLDAKGEFVARNLEAGRYRFEIKLPTDAWYVRRINLPAGVAVTNQQPAQAAPPAVAAKLNQNYPWQGIITIKSGQQVSGVSIFVGQDAAGLRGRVTVTPEGMAVPADLQVHLVPADREQANDVLRYSETMVMSDGSFAFSNLAPGRYFIISRVAAGDETQGTAPRPSAWDPTARAKLRQEAEAAKVVVDLKPCQRLKDYALALRAEQ